MTITGGLLRTAILASILMATPMAGAEEITFEDQRSKTITLTELLRFLIAHHRSRPADLQGG
jgi:hypothetical protein